MEDGAGDGHGYQYVYLCSTLFVHWTVSLIGFFIYFLFLGIHLSCGGGIVFYGAAAFNANISKWETGQVTGMKYSTSTSVPRCLFIGCGVTDLFF